MTKASIVFILIAASSTALHAQTSTETLRTVPAADLASSYRDLVQILGHFALVESGGTLQLPNQTITRDNLEQVKAEMAEQLAAITAAINERGYANVAGTYTAKTTSACKKIPSGWAQGIAGGAISRITITQTGFELQLTQEFTIDGQAGTFEIPGVIVDSTLAFDDMMNSDFGLIGQVKPATIVVRPDVDQILAAWPSWVKAPDRKDLARCEVKMEGHS